MFNSPTLQAHFELLFLLIPLGVLYYFTRALICKLVGISINKLEKCYRTMPAEQRAIGRSAANLLSLLLLSIPVNLTLFICHMFSTGVFTLTLLCTIATELLLSRQRSKYKLSQQELNLCIGAYIAASPIDLSAPYPFELTATRCLAPLIAALTMAAQLV